MRNWKLSSVCMVTLLLFATSLAWAQTVAPVWPIKVSANGRYFAGQDDKPFAYNADTAWSMIQAMNLTEVTNYLEDRRLKEFTVVQMWALPIPLSSNCTGRSITSKEGNHEPFIGGVNNMNNPNENFFNVLGQIMTIAEQKGIVLCINPCWFGYQYLDWANKLTNSNAATYGNYLGNKFKNRPNLMWFVCGDVNPNYNGNEKRDELEQMCNAMLAQQPNWLITGEAATGSPSWSWFESYGWYKYHAGYAYGPGITGQNPWQQVRDGVIRTPARPTINIESYYEPDQTGVGIRKIAWWPFMVGGAGHAYGHKDIWCQAKTSAFNSAGANSMKHLGKFFRENTWAPNSFDSNNTVMTSGQGGDQDRATAIRGDDGSFVYVYIPGSRTVAIDMSKLNVNPVQCRWYNPDNGTYQAIGNYANSGSRSFTTPSSSDWVLALQGEPIPPINKPTGLTATLINNNTQARLDWTDTNTNPNEAGHTIQKKIGDADWVEIGTVGANVVTFTDPNPLYGAMNYTYRVGAHD